MFFLFYTNVDLNMTVKYLGQVVVAQRANGMQLDQVIQVANNKV